MRRFIAGILFCICSIVAENVNNDKPIKFNPISGWGWITAGRVEKCPYNQIDDHNKYFQKEWKISSDIGLIASGKVGKRTQCRLHFGGTIKYPVLKRDQSTPIATGVKKKFSLYLIEASSISQFGDPEKVFFDIKWGYFSVKYNPQATNLGEYLFRGSAYPGILVSGFELADKKKLMGIRIGNSFRDMFFQDIYFDSEIDRYPIYDFSLSYLMSLKFKKFVNFGAGIRFERLIPADKYKTTPGLDTLYTDQGFGKNKNYIYINEDNNDTTRYTFKGTNLMARITLDPKDFLPFEIFGKEDLKIYAEVALLGVKNYPLWYENRKERIPVMFGFNLPTFKILDVLALEFEWYGCQYMNSTKNIWEKRSPVPYAGSSVSTSPEYDTYPYKDSDNWRWSVYASKKVTSFLRLSTQFARDHIQHDQARIYDDVTPRPGDWYWMFRSMFSF